MTAQRSASIIGSLGANYSWSLARLALRQLVFPPASQLELLRDQLAHVWQGQVLLTYKGRDALEVILKSYGIGSGDQVLTQAFTCHAIEEAIVRVGAAPVYVDLAPDGWNPTVKTCQAALKRAPQAKAVLIQHTLGVPAEIEAITAWAHQAHLLVIEDLASAYGAKDQSGALVGRSADATLLSFGRDKILDAVTGGAAILRLSPPHTQTDTSLPVVPIHLVWLDLLYPFLMRLVRDTFEWGAGKVLLQGVRRLGLVRSPVASPTQQAAQLPSQLAPLVLVQLARQPMDRAHRQKIAAIYFQAFHQVAQVELPVATEHELARTSLVRFSCLVPQPDILAQHLVRKGIYITDRWYRCPVDSGALQRPSVYQTGSCPRAEYIADHMINFPTHQAVSVAQAKRLAAAVVDFLQTRDQSQLPQKGAQT